MSTKQRLTAEQARQNYWKLKKELEQIEEALAKVGALNKRKQELLGGWNSLGEIRIAQFDYRNASCPIYSENEFNQKYIVSIDDKWITLRECYEDNVVRYHRDTGRREFKHSDFGSIDPQKAIKAWNEFKSTSPTT